MIETFFTRYSLNILDFDEKHIEILLASDAANSFLLALKNVFRYNYMAMHQKLGIIDNYTLPSGCTQCTTKILKYLKILAKYHQLTAKINLK